MHNPTSPNDLIRRPLAVLCGASLAATLLTASAALAQDSDGDGVPNNADAFPCSAEGAAAAYAPAEGEHGALFFEDLWPENGDLDFNDLVVSYNYEFMLAPDDGSGGTRVSALRLSLNVLAAGAGLHNGLALRLPVSSNLAGTTVTRSFADGEEVALSPVASEQQLVIKVVDDALNLLHGNTDPNSPTAAGVPLTLLVRFATPVEIDLAKAPFDLFMFRSDDFGHQIHQSGYRGTDLMNTALFGTFSDASPSYCSGGDFGGGATPACFVNQQGLPFTLHVPSAVAWPVEGGRIDAAYPDIVAFAASGGLQHADYYLTDIVAEHLWTGGSDGVPAPRPVFLPSNTLDAERETGCVTGEHASCVLTTKKIAKKKVINQDGLLTTVIESAPQYDCSCDPGYEGDPALGCTDINECATAHGGCDAVATCTNTAGGHSCSCPAGTLDVNGNGTLCRRNFETTPTPVSIPGSTGCSLLLDTNADQIQALSDGTVLVLLRCGNLLRLATSLDGGQTFQALKTVTNAGSALAEAATLFARSAQDIFVAQATYPYVHVLRSTDGGNSWSTPVLVATDFQSSGPGPSVDLTGQGSAIYVTWSKPGNITSVRRSPNNGLGWTSLPNVTLSGTNYCPDLGFDASTGDLILQNEVERQIFRLPETASNWILVGAVGPWTSYTDSAVGGPWAYATGTIASVSRAPVARGAAFTTASSPVANTDSYRSLDVDAKGNMVMSLRMGGTAVRIYRWDADQPTITRTNDVTVVNGAGITAIAAPPAGDASVTAIHTIPSQPILVHVQAY